MHHFVNFKNFEDARLDLLRPVTLLIGRNGSGKSNVIEGVELLAQLAQGRFLHEISDVGRGSGSTFEIRGGLNNCSRRETSDTDRDVIDDLLSPKRFCLGFSGFIRGLGSFRYEVAIQTGGRPCISAESLSWKDGEHVFETIQNDDPSILSVRYDNFKRGGRKPVRQLTSDCSVLSRYESLATGDTAKARHAEQLVLIVRQHLQRSYVLDPNPKLMRDYENIGQMQLHRDGSNLASVLYELYRAKTATDATKGQEGRAQALDRILERLKQLPEETFTRFDFAETRHGEVGLGVQYENGPPLSARQMSDGTLRALAILTALETVPEGSRLVIEEMDNGIHPARVKVLVDAIWDTAKRRKLNVLATTHNPATLDQLNAEQIESVVFCFHDSASRASKLIPIPDLPAAESMLEQGRLGELMTQQVLERHVQPGFAAKRAEQGLAWLQKVRQATKAKN